MKFVSTRDSEKKTYNGAEVISRGIAPDGGLFFPCEEVSFTKDELNLLHGMDYAARAAFVISKYLTDYGKNELLAACREAYFPDRFPIGPAPVRKVGDEWFLELYHGPTCAFKDLALQLMPRLLSLAIEKTGMKENALILVATSGDTGKAALEGFRDVPRTSICVFYPDGGVSDIQRKQMVTQKGENVYVCAVKGNFDDCQTGVKKIFGNKEYVSAVNAKGYSFSSANSINFGRLVSQVAYYFSAVTDMYMSDGDACDVVVPTGNFGNILAAYMAKKAGAPIGRLVCASNKNKVLTDFFNTGVYDKRREFYLTTSPSMDILVSSNLERLLYLICGAEKTARYMRDLSEKGIFTVDSEDMEIIRRDFSGYSADEDECSDAIKKLYESRHYLIDTHTAAAEVAARKFKNSEEHHENILVVSTASPFKFAPAVCKALGIEAGEGYGAADKLAEFTGLEIPSPLADVRSAKERFVDVTEKDTMIDTVLGFIK